MHRLNTIYYNKKYLRVGYIFRDRYISEGIYSEDHLYNCIKYIYDNPVKAGICKLASEYPYSHYQYYNKNIKGNYIFLDVDIDNRKLCKELIEEFITINALKKHELEKDMCKLKELINILIPIAYTKIPAIFHWNFCFNVHILGHSLIILFLHFLQNYKNYIFSCHLLFYMFEF